MKIIVNKIESEREHNASLARQGDVYRDTDEPGEGNALAQGGEATTEVRTSPCVIETNHIRCFYPRRNDRPGTRLTFTDGGGFAITESFEIVARACGAIPAAEAAQAVTANINDTQ
jgi:hypothetical protein